LLARKGYIVIPVEELLKSDLASLEELSSKLSVCTNRIYVVTNPGIILVNKLNQVAGTGSIIYEPDCRDYIPQSFRYYTLDKNEWVDVCTLSSQEYFKVREVPESHANTLHNILIVTLTRKMIYPRVFNGRRIPVILVPQKIEEDYEIIMSSDDLDHPVVYFDGENTVYVAQGSEQLLKLKTLLSFEARCDYYRLLARSS
jgi:hypothetical protein